MRAFLATLVIGFLAMFSAALFKTEVEAQAKSPGLVVTAHREVAKPTGQVADKADSPRGQSLSDLESAIDHFVDADEKVEPVQATEVAVAKAAPVKAAAKKCCEDCNCRGECNCSYPGQCLIESAKPKNCKIIVQHCHGGRYCETREYTPPSGDIAGVWKVYRGDEPHRWTRTEFTRALSAVSKPIRKAIEFAIPNAVQSCQSCEGGSCSNQIRVRRGWFR
jgi:hypothetical protein